MEMHELRQMIKQLTEELHNIGTQLERMNKEGITVWGGSTMEEN